MLVKQLQLFLLFEKPPESFNVSLLVWVHEVVGVVQLVLQVGDVVSHTTQNVLLLYPRPAGFQCSITWPNLDHFF